MKTKSKISGCILRNTALAVFSSLVLIGFSWASNSAVTGGSEAQIASQPRAFSFAERVAYQRTIEDVYWRHRIWPKENPDPKPALDAVMSQAQLEKKVENYLRDSLALEDYQKPITADQLQAEMDRMARDTKQPEVLRELFEALGNDPAVIAECLVRPILVERLLADLTGRDQATGVESVQNETVRTLSAVTASGQVAYTLPNIVGACVDDTWTATSTTNAPSARSFHTAVWTGSEMIVWGGENYYSLANGGGRYNPSTDNWTALSTTHAPGLSRHAAVWTGSEMIVWGGDPDVPGTGGRYNPSTDSWTATSTTNAPFGREFHTAVWTGSEMIIWGGAGYFSPEYVYFNTGGRYNPRTDSWTATSTINVPTARSHHRAEWTGSKMIVWGGETGNPGGYLNTGGRYNPSTDRWAPTSSINAPEARSHFTAVWTGSEMIVWGGESQPNVLLTGRRYSPGTDSWTATSTTNAPEARADHTAIWTGNEMIVWGGQGSGFLKTGGKYNPTLDSWTATSTLNAPVRWGHTAIWTGSEMIIWGGYPGYPAITVNTGGRYCVGVPAPVAHPATFIASNSFKANWSSVIGVTYRLDVTTNSSFTAYVTGYRDLNVGNTTTYNVTGLDASNQYYYRVRAYNGIKTSDNSNTVDVTTLTPTEAPVVVTNSATIVENSSATLNGSLDPHGFSTTVYFQYGTTTNYGRTTPPQTQSGNTYRNINANINGLPTNSVYHFRIVATNSAGTTYGADRLFTLVSYDFNNDNHPDCLLFNPATRGTVIWYMNNNVHVTGNYGPTLPPDWEVAAVADFNLDSHPDYLLFNPTTRETVIWYMNNNLHFASNHGPTLPAGWRIGALADLNGDGYPDYLLYNASTGGTVVWYMRNNVRIGSASGPAIPARWILAGVADFSGNGHPDYLLFNPTTHETVIWYMNNNIHVGGNRGPTLPADWEVAGVADFTKDGHPDYLLVNPATHETVMWYMSNNVHVGGNRGPTLPAAWNVVAP